jgi:tRNA pseudouridine55 synthase
VIGLLPLDKPVGPTSHDLVSRARRALGMRRVGHAGTLDPFASGLLLLCLGEATRLVEYLHELDKSYDAEARLGEATTTDDPEGEVIGRSEAWRELSPGAIEEALARQVGTLWQRPPAFSAKKVGGEAAHRKARRGEALELPPAEVVVHEADVLEVDLPTVRFRVRCGTGTYIRSIARDLGDALGCGAHLTALRRTRIGPHQVEGALAPDLLDDRAAVEACLVSPARALAHLPTADVDAADEARLRMGQRVPWSGEPLPPDVPLALRRGAALVGIGACVDGVLQPRKILPGEGEGSA